MITTTSRDLSTQPLHFTNKNTDSPQVPFHCQTLYPAPCWVGFLFMLNQTISLNKATDGVSTRKCISGRFFLPSHFTKYLERIFSQQLNSSLIEIIHLANLFFLLPLLFAFSLKSLQSITTVRLKYLLSSSMTLRMCKIRVWTLAFRNAVLL